MNGNKLTTEAERLAVQRRRFARRRKAASVGAWCFVALGVGCIIGLVVCIIMLGVSEGDMRQDTALAIACVGLLVGVALAFGITFALFRAESEAGASERDCLERLDGEDNFFVGEGTFATFSEHGILIHGESGRRRTEIPVPYDEMRFFHVCSRHEPKENGEWSVVIEIPARYLVKKGKSKPGDPPVLVQTEGKERLYNCLEKYGVVCLGERPARGEKSVRERKFKRVKSFILPDRGKRKKMFLLTVFGFVAAAGGVAAGFLWNAAGGSVICLVGAYVAVRAASSYRKACTKIVLYREGMYWSDRTKIDSTFLKWEEIVSVDSEEKESGHFLRVNCLYGAYDFPAPREAYFCIKERFPEKQTL